MKKLKYIDSKAIHCMVLAVFCVVAKLDRHGECLDQRTGHLVRGCSTAMLRG